MAGEKLPQVNNTVNKRMLKLLKKEKRKKNKIVLFVTFKSGIKSCQQWHVRKEITTALKRVGFDNDLQLMFKYLIHTSFMAYVILIYIYLYIALAIR